jgi:hypothetical protein
MDTMPGPKYPLTVTLRGGRVKHNAKALPNGSQWVVTLCGKRGTPTGDGEGLGWCVACANKPNPQDQRSHI